MLLSKSSMPATLGRSELATSSSRLRSIRSLRLRTSVTNSINAGRAATDPTNTANTNSCSVISNAELVLAAGSYIWAEYQQVLLTPLGKDRRLKGIWEGAILPER